MSIRETLEQLGNEYGERVYKPDGSMYAKSFRALMGTILGWGYVDELMRECRKRKWNYYPNMVDVMIREHTQECSPQELADYVGKELGYD